MRNFETKINELTSFLDKNCKIIEGKAAEACISVTQVALILFHLNKSSVETEKIENLKQRLFKQLMQMKQTDWVFACKSGAKITHMGFLISIIDAISEYNSKVIDGNAIAKILHIFTSTEAREGGPYYSFYKDKSDREIDLSVNVVINNFLMSQNVELENLHNLIETAIEFNNYKSPFLHYESITLYLISLNYKGAQKQKLIDYILSKRDKNGIWENPYYTSLMVSSLLRLGLAKEKYTEAIEYLKKTDLKKDHEAFPIFMLSTSEKEITEFNCPDILTAATLIEALSLLEEEEEEEDDEDAKEEKEMENKIIKLAKKRFSYLYGDIQNIALEMIMYTIDNNMDKQMLLMPYYFKKALGKKGEKFSDELITQLGLANLFYWTAFIIYDDFIDEEGDPKNLPSANVFAREFTTIFNNILPNNKKFQKYFHRLMDKLDSANTWETVYGRTKVENNKVTIPRKIPNYNDYEVAFEPASANILGPVVMMLMLGYDLKSSEIKNLTEYFRGYLIAMQLNDDAHDWEEDLACGQISTVVAMLLDKFREQETIDLKKDKEKLKEIFWHYTIVEAGQTAVKFCQESQEALNSISTIEEPKYLEKFIKLSQNVALEALEEQKKSIDFIKAYEE